jgi:hypothetical protein
VDSIEKCQDEDITLAINIDCAVDIMSVMTVNLHHVLVNDAPEGRFTNEVVMMPCPALTGLSPTLG